MLPNPKLAVLANPSLMGDLRERPPDCTDAVVDPQVCLQPLLVVGVALAGLHDHQDDATTVRRDSRCERCRDRLQRLVRRELAGGPSTLEPAGDVLVHVADEVAQAPERGSDGVELDLQHAPRWLVQHVVGAVDGKHPVLAARPELGAQPQQLRRELVLSGGALECLVEVSEVAGHGIDHEVECGGDPSRLAEFPAREWCGEEGHRSMYDCRR
mmetsp:Transcript_26021/g.61903  ORF Transcript_26021/g.61903 Transcript_26021/m.61903 type:complete len:213 (-) Transcript_26021:373-1011(-)